MLTFRRLGLDDARVLLDAAVARAKAIGVPISVAVSDESGTLIGFERMDGGKVTSVSIAIDKAFTAAGAKAPTSFYFDESNPASRRIQGTNGGRFITLRGGVPVEVDGEIVGAIGVSGGTGQQDVDVADHATTALLAHLGASGSSQQA